MMAILRTACLTLCFCLLAPGFMSYAVANPQTAIAPPATDSEYTVTVIPFYGPEKIWSLYSPFIDFLKETTGKPWTLKLFSTHKTLIDQLCADKVSIALLGPVPLGKVMEQCQAEPIVVALSKDGTPFYRSVLVTTTPAVTSLDRLKGERIGFFSGSTAAHILPLKLLRQAGLTKADFVPVFYEGQDHIVNALLTREISAAGLKETLFAKFKDEGLHVLATSGQLPNFAFAAAPGIKPEIRKLFADTLFNLNPATTSADQQRMATWDDEIKNGFTPPTDSFRRSVKELLTLTNGVMRDDR